MAALTIAETRELEQKAIARGWSEEQLIDLAGTNLGIVISRLSPHPGTAIAFLGKGHNAADALVALRILRDQFAWQIFIRGAYDCADCAPLTQKKWHELGAEILREPNTQTHQSPRPLLLLDALVGIGSTGELRSPLVALAKEMARLKDHFGAAIYSVDLPSGIDVDTGETLKNTLIADVTLMLGNARRGLLLSQAGTATGALAIVPIEPLTARGVSDIELISPQTTTFGKMRRPYDLHKGLAGRVGIFAGSERYPGAAVLAASGALRGGAGLVTLFVPHKMRAWIGGMCPPEVIVCGYDHPQEILRTRFDSLVVGCGLGEITESMGDGVLEVLATTTLPTVIDADALNLIAERKASHLFKANHLITPHPGEFARLAPELIKLSREAAARHWADQFPATLLLKGSRTLVTGRGHSIWCNSTGNPGMATGGQGDLLAGVIAARLAVGDSQIEAACLGAWLCGRSAEIALNSPHLSEDSLLPQDVLHHLGAAFRDWRCSTR